MLYEKSTKEVVSKQNIALGFALTHSFMCYSFHIILRGSALSTTYDVTDKGYCDIINHNTYKGLLFPAIMMFISY